MKTVEDLNKKLFYRFAKVLYFMCLGIVLLFGIAGIYEANREFPTNHSKTRITCAGAESVDIEKSRFGITGTLSNDQKKEIAREICGLDTSLMLFWEKESRFGLTYLSNNNIFVASDGVMEEKIKVLGFVGYTLLLLIGMFVLTEILRRLAYYIFLGRLRPIKD
jgi:hypothetical protein